MRMKEGLNMVDDVDIKHRKWEYYKGESKFWCNGSLLHLQLSDSWQFIGLLCIISITFLLFMIFTGFALGVKVSIIIPIEMGVLFYYTMFNMLSASFMDPGIIPRSRPTEISQTLTTLQLILPRGIPVENTKLPLTINGKEIKVSYCYSCKFFRPPRVAHCSSCDNCVDRLDHHCPWIGNCIGRRNYSKFYRCLLFGCLTSLSSLGFTILHIVIESKENNLLDMMKKGEVIISFILLFLSFGLTVPGIGLLSYHTYLLCKGITTREEMKVTYNEYHENPFDRGSYCKNFIGTLCDPTPYSYLDPHGIVTKEFMDDLEDNKINQEELLIESSGEISGEISSSSKNLNLN